MATGFYCTLASAIFLIAATSIGATAEAQAPVCTEDGKLCSYYSHPYCPALDAKGSPDLRRYPFLVDQLVETVKSMGADMDCEIDESGSDGSPPAAEVQIIYTVITQRPGLVCIDDRRDGIGNGAAHPFSSERLACYDPTSQAKITFETVFPSMTPGTPAFDGMIAQIDGHLALSCCDEPASDGSFAELYRDDPLPDGWAVDDAGNLVLGFTYSAFGRSYIATATVERASIIDAVAPDYRSFFVAAPNVK
jgi:hypothetical protein